MQIQSFVRVLCNFFHFCMPFIWVCTSAYFNNWVICSAFCGRSPMLYYITYHVRQSLHDFDTVTLSSNQLICVSIRLISTAVAENLILYYSLPFYSWSPLYFTIWIGCTFCCYHYVIHTGSFYYSSQYCCLFSLIQVPFSLASLFLNILVLLIISKIDFTDSLNGPLTTDGTLYQCTLYLMTWLLISDVTIELCKWSWCPTQCPLSPLYLSLPVLSKRLIVSLLQRVLCVSSASRVDLLFTLSNLLWFCLVSLVWFLLYDLFFSFDFRGLWSFIVLAVST